jgi:hypothetical protein
VYGAATTASERCGHPLPQARIGCASEPARNRTLAAGDKHRVFAFRPAPVTGTSAPAGICGSVTLRARCRA